MLVESGVFRASRHVVGTVGMESRFRLRCAASTTLRSPPPCGEVERGPFAATVACSLAEEGFDSPVDFSDAGVSAVKAYAAVGDFFPGLRIGTPYIVI